VNSSGTEDWQTLIGLTKPSTILFESWNSVCHFYELRQHRITQPDTIFIASITLSLEKKDEKRFAISVSEVPAPRTDNTKH
jgi:hypothetical protein